MGKVVKCIKHMLSHNITGYGDLIVEFGLSFDVHGTDNLKPTMCICTAMMHIPYIGGSNGWHTHDNIWDTMLEIWGICHKTAVCV